MQYNHTWIMSPLFKHLNKYMSKDTVYTHFNKHHIQYAINLYNLLNEEERIYPLHHLQEKYKDLKNTSIYNNLYQIIAHNMFWSSLTDKSILDNETEISLKQQIIDLLPDIQTCARKLFGSGYIWIIYENSHIKVISTPNADIPDACILICIDVWEHSYYLDYKQDRVEYITNLINNCINWSNVYLRYISK